MIGSRKTFRKKNQEMMEEIAEMKERQRRYIAVKGRGRDVYLEVAGHEAKRR